MNQFKRARRRREAFLAMCDRKFKLCRVRCRTTGHWHASPFWLGVRFGRVPSVYGAAMCPGCKV